MNQQQKTFRRIVTGHDADNKAVIVSDAAPVNPARAFAREALLERKAVNLTFATMLAKDDEAAGCFNG